MRERHVTQELLWSMLAGEDAQGRGLQVAIDHLLALCPRCRAEYQAFERELARLARERPATYAEAYERAMSRLGESEAEAAAENRQAVKALEYLKTLPPDERAAIVNREPERFQGATLASSLLEEARSLVTSRPGESLALLRLARLVLDHTPSSPFVIELYARILAHTGNVHRVQENLVAAGELLEDARYLVESHGSAEPVVLAELDHLAGSLARAQRRLEDSEALLTRALQVYRQQDLPVEAARVSLKLGLTHREAGKLEEGLAATRQALDLLASEEQPRLLLMAYNNLAQLLIDDGRYGEARLALRAASSTPDASPWVRLRLLCLEGRVARGLGDSVAAAGAFRAAREGFLREGRPYLAAVASLDLAALYLQEGKTGEVKRLAEEMVSVFGGKGIHREATAALLLFADSARRERVTETLLVELTAYLQAARHNRELPFRGNG